MAEHELLQFAAGSRYTPAIAAQTRSKED